MSATENRHIRDAVHQHRGHGRRHEDVGQRAANAVAKPQPQQARLLQAEHQKHARPTKPKFSSVEQQVVAMVGQIAAELRGDHFIGRRPLAEQRMLQNAVQRRHPDGEALIPTRSTLSRRNAAGKYVISTLQAAARMQNQMTRLRVAGAARMRKNASSRPQWRTTCCPLSKARTDSQRRQRDTIRATGGLSESGKSRRAA